MKLDTFGIDIQKNLIIQIPVFVPPTHKQNYLCIKLKQSQYQFWTLAIKFSLIPIEIRETLHSFK